MHCHENIPLEDVSVHWCINSQRQVACCRVEDFPAVRRNSSFDLQGLTSSVIDLDRRPGASTYYEAPYSTYQPLKAKSSNTRRDVNDSNVDPWSALARDQLLVLDGTSTLATTPGFSLSRTSRNSLTLAPAPALLEHSGKFKEPCDPWSALARDQQLGSVESLAKTPPTSSVHARRAHADSVRDALFYCDLAI
jgi:hypothetical protein